MPVAKKLCSVCFETQTETREKQIDFKSDLGGNLIGKKYSIMDEIGVNYSIVVDHDSIRHSPRNRVGNLPVV